MKFLKFWGSAKCFIVRAGITVARNNAAKDLISKPYLMDSPFRITVQKSNYWYYTACLSLGDESSFFTSGSDELASEFSCCLLLISLYGASLSRKRSTSLQFQMGTAKIGQHCLLTIITDSHLICQTCAKH